MSEPYALPSRGCCWAGAIAHPHPCPWHPAGTSALRDWRGGGAAYDAIDPTPDFPTLLVPGRDGSSEKCEAENERMVADWRRRAEADR